MCCVVLCEWQTNITLVVVVVVVVDWQCAVFLAPMAASQSFCVHPPPWFSPSSPVPIPPAEAKGDCVPACLSADHALVPILPFEEQGGGWNGAYYFIRPYSAFESAATTWTSSHGVLLQDRDRDQEDPRDIAAASFSFLADTLESGFGEERMQCLPAKSQCNMLQLSFAREYLDEGTHALPFSPAHIHSYIHHD